MNSKKLKIKLFEQDKTLEELANYIGCNITTLYRKLNGDSDFSRSEVQLIAAFLSLSASDVNTIFFDEKLA
jgi:transcriptional regulator with XRE-family HTH domain